MAMRNEAANARWLEGALRKDVGVNLFMKAKKLSL
jgi:hypothetical protein